MPGKLSHVALRTSLLYALVAAVWILVSDKMLVALVHDPVIIEEIAVCKGWAFVAVTALLLFGALRGQLRRWEQEAAARRLAEAYLAEAQRLSHTGSVGWNVTTDEHVWSDETFRIFDYGASTKITLPLILERVHPEDRTTVQETLNRAAHEGGDLDFEHRLLMPNGAVKHLHIVAHAAREDSGRVEFVGAVMDVTAQKSQQVQFRESEEQYRRIVDTASEGICMFDEHYNTTFVNRRFAEMLGYEPEDMLGRKYNDFLFEEDLAVVEERTAARQQSAAERYELSVRRKDGRHLWVHISATPILDPQGRFQGSFSMFTDIT